MRTEKEEAYICMKDCFAAAIDNVCDPPLLKLYIIVSAIGRANKEMGKYFRRDVVLKREQNIIEADRRNSCIQQHPGEIERPSP